MLTKNSVVKMENLVVNHKSQPIKSNPECIKMNPVYLNVVKHEKYILIVSASTSVLF